jgi:hypothetical protein
MFWAETFNAPASKNRQVIWTICIFFMDWFSSGFEPLLKKWPGPKRSEDDRQTRRI